MSDKYRLNIVDSIVWGLGITAVLCVLIFNVSKCAILVKEQQHEIKLLERADK